MALCKHISDAGYGLMAEAVCYHIKEVIEGVFAHICPRFRKKLLILVLI